ncbi:MAG TPA: hypothetical protein VMY16_12910 [Ilumatobacteraceae bacterium]|nr:hypothetical protein [Ilumatobacteraceae bacterium]
MIRRTAHGTASRYGRRDALKIGGLTVSAAALVAACGDDRTGDEAPGRVGYAPPITDPPDYPIDDAVLLRTASSLELTLALVYETILGIDLLDDEQVLLVEQLLESHVAIAAEMGELTESIDGVAWECTNPWYMERLVDPLLVAVQGSDDPKRDIINTAVALENIAAATHQTLTLDLDDADASAATIAAATLESRHAAGIVAASRGPEGYVSPTIGGGGVQNDAQGIPFQFSVTDTFGSTGQIELVVGAPDENGVRETFILQTPSLNALIYNELEPTC